MTREGPDISCSMDPTSLQELVDASNIVFEARGGSKGPVTAEEPTIAFASVSVVAIKDINPGETLDETNIWVKRPGGGDFNVLDYPSLLGRTAAEAIRSGFQLKKANVSPPPLDE